MSDQNNQSPKGEVAKQNPEDTRTSRMDRTRYSIVYARCKPRIYLPPGLPAIMPTRRPIHAGRSQIYSVALGWHHTAENVCEQNHSSEESAANITLRQLLTGSVAILPFSAR